MSDKANGHISREITLDADGRWWHSNLNKHPAVTVGESFAKTMIIRDCTLREGEEMGGASLGIEHKVRLARLADEIGIREIEVGYCGAIPEHQDMARVLKDAGVRASLTSINRSYTRDGEWQREVDLAVAAGVDCVHFVVFSNEDLLASVPWLAKEDVPARVVECVTYARASGVKVGYALAGSGRTELEDILTCARAAASAGAEVIGVTDSMGCSTPEAVAFLVREVREAVGPEHIVSFHGHNTFGLATANALAAARAGAGMVDTVPLGIGEGAGIAALEEVVFSLEVLYGVRTGLNVSKIADMARLAREAFGVELIPTKPFIGNSIYRHTIDSHIASILRGKWHSWECIHPSVVGQSRSLEFANSKIRSGRSGAIGAKISQLGYSPSDEEVEELIGRIRQMTLGPGWLSEQEVESVIHSAFQADSN